MIDELTDRELQVLRWLLHTPRLTLARIGKRLNIDRCSVASHEKNICAKLGVCGREGLLQFVWSHNISLDSLKRRSKHPKRIRPPSRSGPPGAD